MHLVVTLSGVKSASVRIAAAPLCYTRSSSVAKRAAIGFSHLKTGVLRSSPLSNFTRFLFDTTT